MKISLSFQAYEESNFWLAFSPLTDGQRIRGFFFEIGRRRVELVWRNGVFD